MIPLAAPSSFLFLAYGLYFTSLRFPSLLLLLQCFCKLTISVAYLLPLHFQWSVCVQLSSLSLTQLSLDFSLSLSVCLPPPLTTATRNSNCKRRLLLHWRRALQPKQTHNLSETQLTRETQVSLARLADSTRAAQAQTLACQPALATISAPKLRLSRPMGRTRSWRKCKRANNNASSLLAPTSSASELWGARATRLPAS